MVLESRHLIGVFLLMVVISGIVFTLGYVLGRSQYEAQLRAAHSGSEEAALATGTAPAPPKTGGPAPKTQPAGPGTTPAPSDRGFSRSDESKKTGEVQKSGKNAGAPGKTAAATQPAPRPAAAKGGGLLNAPLIPRGAIILQVAAVTKESDALALAEALQQKKFPAFVLTPSSDHYYRVQVGPYADAQSANLARHGLENEGFKAIIKR